MIVDDESALTALKILGSAVLGAVGWKGILRLRRDKRADNAEVREDDASGAAEAVYIRTIARLERDIERLQSAGDAMGKRLDALGERLNQEIQLRFDAQETARVLRERVIALEQEIRELKLARGAGVP